MSIEHAPQRDAPAVRKMISKRALLDLIPLSYPTIWQLMRRGKFPRSVKLGDGPNAKVAWYLDEVSEYQASLERTELKPSTAHAEQQAEPSAPDTNSSMIGHNSRGALKPGEETSDAPDANHLAEAQHP